MTPAEPRDAATPQCPGVRPAARWRAGAGPLKVSALSREDVWAIGPTVNTAARGLGDLVAHCRRV